FLRHLVSLRGAFRCRLRFCERRLSARAMACPRAPERLVSIGSERRRARAENLVKRASDTGHAQRVCRHGRYGGVTERWKLRGPQGGTGGYTPGPGGPGQGLP